MTRLFEEILNEILAEQNAKSNEQEVTGNESVYTPEQQKFLANFAQNQTDSLGIVYSLSPAGIQEFINRSGAMYNLSTNVLTQLLKTRVISIVPYTGYSRNTDYTIKCNVPLESLTGFSTGDDTDAGEVAPGVSGDTGGNSDFTGGSGLTTADLATGGDTGADVGGETLPAGGETPPTGAEEPIGADVPEEGAELPDEGPEESFRKDGDLLFEADELVHVKYTYPQILHETAKIAKKLITEQRGNETFSGRASKSRVLNRLPIGYLNLLERIIKNLSGTIHSTLEKEHLVADILDNLAHNFGLTPNQILKSYTFYKNQNRLQNLIKK
jgi:hypothetical protein